MSQSSGGFTSSPGFKNFMAKLYGWGASVVILGALFKLMHWPGAGLMLIVGLCTEAFIFFMSAFEPRHEDPDWTLVYPELAGSGNSKKKEQQKDMAGKLERMLDEAKIKQETINKLGDGLKSLNKSVEGLGTVSDAALATDEYARKIKQVSGTLEGMNKSYADASKSVQSLGESTKVSEGFYKAMSGVTEKLNSMNSMYELELKESDSHSKALSNYHGSMARAIENLSATEKSTQQLKDEMGKLSKNLSSLNHVYGTMLSAMSGVKQA